MKTTFLAVMAALFATILPIRAQDAATEERLDKLNGYVQDMQATQDAQRKKIDDLSKQIDDLRDQLSKPGNNATADDLRKLADQVQEIDKKREADKELILKEIEALGKTGGSTKPKHTTPKVEDTYTAPSAPTGAGDNSMPASPNDKGFEYSIQKGDTLMAISQAYREKGIKITSDDILKANPGLKANSLRVGQKIFIPAPPQTDAKPAN